MVYGSWLANYYARLKIALFKVYGNLSTCTYLTTIYSFLPAAFRMKDRRRRFKKVPKGTSEYQAAWIISSDGDEEEEDCEDEDYLGTGLEAESLEDSGDEAASTVRSWVMLEGKLMR